MPQARLRSTRARLHPAALHAVLTGVHDVAQHCLSVRCRSRICRSSIRELIPEKPLRETVAAAASDFGMEAGETFPLPTSDDPVPELLRGLSVLADRQTDRRYLAHLVHRAGVNVSVRAAGLLLRINPTPVLNPAELARTYQIPAGDIEGEISQLKQRGLIDEAGPRGDSTRGFTLTAAGCEIVDALLAARRNLLEELWSDWPDDKRAEVAIVLHRLAKDLVPERRSA